MKSIWRILISCSVIISIIGFFTWQVLFPVDGISNMATDMKPNTDINSNVTSTKMTYGRFLEYLDMGWIKRVDLYDNSRTAIVEALSPELGNRPQRIRVEIPAGASQLIVKLKEYNVDFDAHPPKTDSFIFTLLSNLLVPTIFVAGLIFLFQRSNNFPGGPGQAARQHLRGLRPVAGPGRERPPSGGIGVRRQGAHRHHAGAQV